MTIKLTRLYQCEFLSINRILKTPLRLDDFNPSRSVGFEFSSSLIAIKSPGQTRQNEAMTELNLCRFNSKQRSLNDDDMSTTDDGFEILNASLGASNIILTLEETDSTTIEPPSTDSAKESQLSPKTTSGFQEHISAVSLTRILNMRRLDSQFT